MMFTTHQIILSKKLIMMIYVKNHLNDACKLSFLNVQKLLFQEAIMINEITRSILNMYHYIICLIMILYHFVSVFLLI